MKEVNSKGKALAKEQIASAKEEAPPTAPEAATEVSDDEELLRKYPIIE